MDNVKNVSIKKSSRKNKKWVATFTDDKGNVVKSSHFGDNRYQDYTQHKDDERKNRYISRHSKEDWSNPTTPATLSRFILWELPNIKQSIADYKRRFKLK